MSMVIIIPTRGRVGKQITFSNLTAPLRRRTVIACQQREQAAHAGNHPQLQDVWVQLDETWTIARKRRWIMEHAAERGIDKLVMMDDDLRFCVRRDDDRKLFRTASPEDVESAFRELEEKLSPAVPHAGFSARGGGISPRAQEGGWQRAKRMMYVLGYHVPTVMANCDPFRIETREDMDTSLQLLRKGIPNEVNYTFAVDQKYGAPGGASLERDFGRSNSDALLLAKYHPGLVRVVEKTYSVSVSRLEVVVSWEKALREGEKQLVAESDRSKERSGRARAG